MIVTKTFDNHADWLEFRKSSVGSSEIAAVCGVNKYLTALDVYLRKTELGEEEENIAMMMGHAGEPVVAEWFCRETGAQMIKESEGEFIVYDDAAPWRTASPDRYVVLLDGTQAILECKTCNSYSPLRSGMSEADAWEACPHYLLQVIWQMGVTGVHDAYLAFIKDNREFGYLPVTWSEETFSDMCEKADAFVKEHLDKGVPPEPTAVKDYAIRQSESKAVECDDVSAREVERLREVKEDIAALEKEEKMLTERLQLVMGDADTLTIDGVAVATWKSSKPSARFDTKRFKAEHSDLYQAYCATADGTRRFLLK